MKVNGRESEREREKGRRTREMREQNDNEKKNHVTKTAKYGNYYSMRAERPQRHRPFLITNTEVYVSTLIKAAQWHNDAWSRGGCINGLHHNMPYHASHQRSYKQRMAERFRGGN